LFFSEYSFNSFDSINDTNKKTTPNPNNTLLANSFFNTPLFENDNNAIDIEEYNPTLRKFV